MIRDVAFIAVLAAGICGGCSVTDAARVAGNVAGGPKPAPHNTTFVCQLPAVPVGAPAEAEPEAEACPEPLDEDAFRDAFIEGHCVRAASHPSRYRCVFP